MNKDKIKEIVVCKIDEITVLCEQISPDFDKDVIHDFRVTFKYLRSFLRLIRAHNKEKGLKLSDRLKDLYQTAGIIRDAQLELEKINIEGMELADYTLLLNNKIELQKKKWNKFYSKRVLHQFKKRAEGYNFEELPAGVLSNFLNSRMASIDLTMQIESPSDVQIHSVRKNAKDMIYTSDLAKKNSWKGVKNELKPFPLKKLNDVADKIGDYNDERQLISNISSFSTHTKEQEEREEIEKIRKTKEPKILSHKKNIITLVKELFDKGNH